MELESRVTLLDRLLGLAQPEPITKNDLAALVNLLAGLPSDERDTLLEYFSNGVSEQRIARLTQVAQLDRADQRRFLKALGIHASSVRCEMNNALDFLGQRATETKRVIKDLSSVRKTLETHCGNR